MAGDTSRLILLITDEGKSFLGHRRFLPGIDMLRVETFMASNTGFGADISHLFLGKQRTLLRQRFFKKGRRGLLPVPNECNQIIDLFWVQRSPFLFTQGT